MATLTCYDSNQILFRRTADERLVGISALGWGALFVFFTVGCVTHLHFDAPGFLMLALCVLPGLGMAGWYLVRVLRSDSLSIDLRHPTYRARRGFLVWAERLDGHMEDFDQIRVVPARREAYPQQPCWVVEWVWKDGSITPFRVEHWTRPKSFRLTRGWDDDDHLALLRTLRCIAKDTGLPLAVPEAYLGNAGVTDRDLDITGG